MRVVELVEFYLGGYESLKGMWSSFHYMELHLENTCSSILLLHYILPLPYVCGREEP